MKAGDLVKVSGIRWRGDRSLHKGKVGIIIEQSGWPATRRARRWEVFIEGDRWVLPMEQLEVLNKSDKGENND